MERVSRPQSPETGSNHIVQTLQFLQGLPLPYLNGNSDEVNGRRWETCLADCRWGNRCILGWRPVSAGGPGSHRCPGGGGGAVSKVCGVSLLVGQGDGGTLWSLDF